MRETPIYNRITEVTRAHFGHPVNPHLFRDCAATSLATQDPAHAHFNMQILGHSTLATSERYYNHATSQAVSAAYQANLLALRRGTANRGASKTSQPKV